MKTGVSDRLMYLQDRDSLTGVMINREYDSEQFPVTVSEDIPKKGNKEWVTGVALKERYPRHKIEWIFIGKKGHHKDYPGAVITMSTGKYLVFRNGDNISRHNFCMLDYQDSKMYFRCNMKDILDVLAVVSATTDDLPLLYSRGMSDQQMTLLKKRIGE